MVQVYLGVNSLDYKLKLEYLESCAVTLYIATVATASERRTIREDASVGGRAELHPTIG
jgi:hypothetical protein